MILEWLLDAVYALLQALSMDFSIPALDPQVYTAVNSVLDVLISGVRILMAYFDIRYLAILLFAFISFEAGIYFYRLLMWVLNKIPFLDID